MLYVRVVIWMICINIFGYANHNQVVVAISFILGVAGCAITWRRRVHSHLCGRRGGLIRGEQRLSRCRLSWWWCRGRLLSWGRRLLRS